MVDIEVSRADGLECLLSEEKYCANGIADRWCKMEAKIYQYPSCKFKGSLWTCGCHFDVPYWS